MPKQPNQHHLLGAIHDDDLYTLPELKRRILLSRRGWETMKKDGIRTVKLEANTYVLGSEVRRWFETRSCNLDSLH